MEENVSPPPHRPREVKVEVRMEVEGGVWVGAGVNAEKKSSCSHGSGKRGASSKREAAKEKSIETRSDVLGTGNGGDGDGKRSKSSRLEAEWRLREAGCRPVEIGSGQSDAAGTTSASDPALVAELAALDAAIRGAWAAAVGEDAAAAQHAAPCERSLGPAAPGWKGDDGGHVQKLIVRRNELRRRLAPPPVAGQCRHFIAKKQRFCSSLASGAGDRCSVHAPEIANVERAMVATGVAAQLAASAGACKTNIRRTPKRMANPLAKQ